LRALKNRGLVDLPNYATYKIVAGNAIAATVKVRLISVASPKLITVLIPCDTIFSKEI
jgi:hypothetical protein